MIDSDKPVRLSTPNAPAAVGPYSQAIVSRNLLFVSGQLPVDQKTGLFAEGGIEERTHQCLKNIKAIAEAAGTGLDRAVKVSVFMTDMNNLARINQVYMQYFGVSMPARSAIQVVGLPKNADVEIEAIFSL